MLRDMATEHLSESTGPDGEPNGKIYWAVISKAVGHPYQDCRNKWRALKTPAFKKGFFTDEEDQIVIKRVREWGNNGPGIWKVLEKELGRSEHSIYMGWNKRISKLAAKQLNLPSTVNTSGEDSIEQPSLAANTSNSSGLFQPQELSDKTGSSSNAGAYTSAFLRGGHRGGRGSNSSAKSKLYNDDNEDDEDDNDSGEEGQGREAKKGGEMQGHDLISSVLGKGVEVATTIEDQTANVVSVLPRARPLKRSGSNNAGIWTPEMVRQHVINVGVY